MRKRRVASPLSRRVRRVARPHTGLWRLRYARYPGSRLRSGNPAAQVAVRLVLLGSPPDTVHGAALRGTDPSSLLTWVRRHNAVPGAGIHPCCSGLQVQGTANSPISAVLPTVGAEYSSPDSLLHFSRVGNDNFWIFPGPRRTGENGPGPRPSGTRARPSEGRNIMKRGKVYSMAMRVEAGSCRWTSLGMVSFRMPSSYLAEMSSGFRSPT